MLLRLSLVILCLCLLSSPLSAQQLSGTVSWIYDGDTLRVEPFGKVRLLGIDTPESRDSDRDRYYRVNFGISSKRLRQIAHRAKQFNIKRVKGKRVQLRFDSETRDKYGRTLAYLYLPDGRLLNRLLLEKGLASVFRRYSFRQKTDFLAAEKAARLARLGLWQ
ncbi:MAG: hypothetical protein GXP51_04480 [Deltaproteobacteria bacterium]|nr:hypothetical protein [Deltaproteobacteria bacterium]